MDFSNSDSDIDDSYLYFHNDGVKKLLPLFFAIANGNMSRVSELLEKGYDPNKQDRSGNTVLHYSIYNRNDFNRMNVHLMCIPDDPYKETRSSFAGITHRDEYLQCLQALMHYGADVNACNEKGETPLTLSLKREKYLTFNEFLPYADNGLFHEKPFRKRAKMFLKMLSMDDKSVKKKNLYHFDSDRLLDFFFSPDDTDDSCFLEFWSEWDDLFSLLLSFEDVFTYDDVLKCVYALLSYGAEVDGCITPILRFSSLNAYQKYELCTIVAEFSEHFSFYEIMSITCNVQHWKFMLSYSKCTLEQVVHFFLGQIYSVHSNRRLKMRRNDESLIVINDMLCFCKVTKRIRKFVHKLIPYVNNVQNKTYNDRNDIFTKVLDQVNNCRLPALALLCRDVIRYGIVANEKITNAKALYDSVQTLKIPRVLKDLIMYKDVFTS